MGIDQFRNNDDVMSIDMILIDEEVNFLTSYFKHKTRFILFKTLQSIYLINEFFPSKEYYDIKLNH